MSIIRGKTRKIDVLKIDSEAKEQSVDAAKSEEIPIESAPTSRANADVSEASTPQRKTIYAIAGLEWGMYRNVEEITDNYWYWGKRLKSRVAYLFSVMTFKPWPQAVDARVKYVEACEGCSKCFTSELEEKKRRNQKVLFNAIYICLF